MSEKQVHIVFQILNFFHNEVSRKYKLTDPEKLLLINLASHKGKKGIFPLFKTIAREMSKGYSSIKRIAKILSDKGLIKINHSVGKGNKYLFTTQLTDELGLLHTRLTDELGTRLTDELTPGSSVSRVYITTKEITKVNNKERARAKRAPLSADFILNSEGIAKGKEVSEKVGLSLDDLLTKFKNVAKTKDKVSGDWHAEWQNFLINERPQGFMPAKTAPEVKSTVKWFEVPEWQKKKAPIVEDKTPLPTPAEGLKKMREARLKQNGQHGGLPNGHAGGHHGRGSGSS